MKKIAHKIRHPHSVEYETAPKQARLDSRGHGVAPEGLVEGAGQVAVAAPEREGSFVMGNVTHVKVSVLQARNLLQADRFGLSDPYVQLELGDQKVQTRVVFDTCHPYWKQDFVLSLPADARTLQCGVWDYDRPPSAPDFLGSVAVDLNKLLQTSESAGTALATEPQWYALSKPQKHGQAQGELRMAVRLLHNSELETEQVVLPPRQYEQYTLEAKVIGTRGLVSTLNTGIHKGLSAAVFVGAFQAKTSRTMSGSPSEEDGIELFWDEEFEVPMDTALAAKEHTGLVRSMTHHFTEQAYDQLKKQAALEEVRFTLKRFRGRRGPTGRSSDIVGTAVFPLCAVPEVSAMADDNDDTASVVTMSDTPRAAQDEAPEEPETPELQEKSIVETISKAATSLPHTISSNVLQPLAGVLHLKLAENGAESAAKDELKAEGSGTSAASVEAKAEASAAGGKTELPVVNTQYWLPLDRAGKGTVGELLVSLSFKKKDLGSAAGLDEEADDAPDAPEPVPYQAPEPLEHSLVDETVAVSASRLFQILFGSKASFAEAFCQARKCWDVDIGDWKSHGSQQVRQVSYTMPLKKNSLGPSEAACIEEYKLETKGPGGWLITVTASTPKVPYGSSFHNSVQFACWHKARGQCQLRISGQVVFTKSVFVRGMISKASLEGMQETYRTFMVVMRDQLGSAAPAAPTTAAAAQQEQVKEAVRMHMPSAWIQPAMLIVLGLLLLTMLAALRHINRAVAHQDDVLREVLSSHAALREAIAQLHAAGTCHIHSTPVSSPALNLTG